jgi:hypothetical protein
MCTNTLPLAAKRKGPHASAASDPSSPSQSDPPGDHSSKNLQQPFPKSPVGHFTAKCTSPEQILHKHGILDARKNLVAQVGLENFIRAITQPLNLTLPDKVKFNMNGQGIMQSWEDVYLAERVYTRCLGISKRIYQTHAFTHEPDRKLAYFVLEEHNERSLWFLPGFDFYVLVFTYYDDEKNVTRVDVQYDQMSFFLHCMGLAQARAWLVERIITPFVLLWARLYFASGFVNPFTFLLQFLIVPISLIYFFLWA